jgi:hypothetical protein
VYGGYEENEVAQWFGEFQIDVNDPEQIKRLFRDATQPVEISAKIELAQSERDFLANNAEKLVEPIAWSIITGQPRHAAHFSHMSIATQLRQFGDRAKSQIEQFASTLRQAAAESSLDLALTITPDSGLIPATNEAIELLFQIYNPNFLGVIEYHGASRTYQRESIGGINLDARQLDAQRKQQTLYNWQQKYSNVKTQLATTYVQGLISEKSGVAVRHSDLNETLKELFATFFPDKEYQDITPDPNGGLRFTVKTKSGQVHDINELSSGEKEVLFGYLWLRNSTPANSTILLDEPELHLNPGLLHGFPDFYHRHIGKARNNQLWLVTHSDALLRRAVSNASYSVYHLIASDAEEATTNQAVKISAHDALERATIDLVGDLAMYRPQGKVVLFEGGGDTETDVWITGTLFKSFKKSANLVSGGSKQRVKDLYEVLARTAEQVGMAGRFFAVTDRDSVPLDLLPEGTQHLSWDVYHIENYLLEPKFVREAVNALSGRSRFSSDEDVAIALREAAEQVLPGLVHIRLQKFIDDKIWSSVNVAGDRGRVDVAAALFPSVTSTFKRLSEVQDVLDLDFLEAEEGRIRENLREALGNDSWAREFPGRSILKQFVDRIPGGKFGYELLRNMIVDQMADAGYRPPGMLKVINVILEAEIPLLSTTSS